MSLSTRRLGPGDEAILNLLAAEEADFDLSGRGEPLEPLDPDTARRYLENPAVLHWVAADDDIVVGDLYCILLPLSSGAGRELLLYEIGVRTSWRRRGVGRALIAEMEGWMRANRVAEVWVLADNPGAADFYRACGFSTDDSMALYMTRELDGPES
ncbi:MAG: GNAT family N-acetyltransferase [Chloroflexota bacterium]|nr:GNAT family N-acetyltransferase [Chloroflexota bacterium]